MVDDLEPDITDIISSAVFPEIKLHHMPNCIERVAGRPAHHDRGWRAASQIIIKSGEHWRDAAKRERLSTFPVGARAPAGIFSDHERTRYSRYVRPVVTLR